MRVFLPSTAQVVRRKRLRPLQPCGCGAGVGQPGNGPISASCWMTARWPVCTRSRMSMARSRRPFACPRASSANGGPVRVDDSVTRHQLVQGLGAMVAPALVRAVVRAARRGVRSDAQSPNPAVAADRHPLAIRRQRQRPSGARARSALGRESAGSSCSMDSQSSPTAGAR